MVGLLATSLQIVTVWSLIGVKSLYFLLVCVGAFIALVLNSKGQFWWSKRFFVGLTYAVGLITTIFLGGAGLYHIGVLGTFMFSLILFDYRKEPLEILIGFGMVVLILLVGEIGLFNPPDFSHHEHIGILRLVSVFNVVAIPSILIVFVLRLSTQNEVVLEDRKLNLERQVKERTKVLSKQKKELTIQNKEKEVLLKEVHHRVNNNLQVIVSLINLQSSLSEDDQVVNALSEIRSRVLSMALVHKKMYQTSNFVNIGFQDYLVQMIENVSFLYQKEAVDFTINVDENTEFELEVAIPLGLIFNEIVTNFFKYAHSDANSRFSVSLTSENDKCLFRYSDNGPGFVDEKSRGDGFSLGLQLIQSLSEQINGDFKYYSENGAVYEVMLHKKSS
ncbi:MAG: sensor histidine kinase [Crocinitomicaceae bacterium]|nr:sensor histidine kinase [Crocinitomicaceae bacterium]